MTHIDLQAELFQIEKEIDDIKKSVLIVKNNAKSNLEHSNTQQDKIRAMQNYKQELSDLKYNLKNKYTSLKKKKNDIGFQLTGKYIAVNTANNEPTPVHVPIPALRTNNYISQTNATVKETTLNKKITLHTESDSSLRGQLNKLIDKYDSSESSTTVDKDKMFLNKINKLINNYDSSESSYILKNNDNLLKNQVNQLLSENDNKYNSSDNNSNKKKISSLNDANTSLMNQITSLNDKDTSLMNQINILNDKDNSLENQISILHNNNQSLRDQINQLVINYDKRDESKRDESNRGFISDKINNIGHNPSHNNIPDELTVNNPLITDITDINIPYNDLNKSYNNSNKSFNTNSQSNTISNYTNELLSKKSKTYIDDDKTTNIFNEKLLKNKIDVLVSDALTKRSIV